MCRNIPDEKWWTLRASPPDAFLENATLAVASSEEATHPLDMTGLTMPYWGWSSSDDQSYPISLQETQNAAKEKAVYAGKARGLAATLQAGPGKKVAMKQIAIAHGQAKIALLEASSSLMESGSNPNPNPNPSPNPNPNPIPNPIPNPNVGVWSYG